MTRREFTSLVDRQQGAFRRFLLGLCCGDVALADDIAQESYIKAFIALDSLKEVSHFNAWIYRIGYNTFINHKRKEIRYVQPEAAADVASSDRADDAFRYQALYHALSQLGEKERTAILLFYMEDYSTKDIATLIGCKVEAVRQLLTRGRGHLRELLSLKS